MTNLVLYRKYRPKTFSEVIGQEHVVKTITNELSSGMISHGYLFCGPRGSGKTTLARLLAKALNCQNRKEKEFEPCNQCDNCREINAGYSMDLIEIDAASNRGINEIRELIDGIRFSPTKSKYKVFILDEAHQLTKEAANALLKTLEEPPGHAIFILATTETHKMIPTIISRCQRFDFWRLTVPQIVQKLELICQKEKLKADKAALELIALNAGGSFRDAESLLEQASAFAENSRIEVADARSLLGLSEVKTVSDFLDLVLTKQAAPSLDLLNNVFERGEDLQQFAKQIINYLRQMLLLRIGGQEMEELPILGLTKEEFQKMAEQNSKIDEPGLRRLLNLVLDAENKMKFSPILQLPLELAVIEFCHVV